MALAAVVTAVAVREDVPLESARPDVRESADFCRPPVPEGLKSDFARLWEDPLEVSEPLQVGLEEAERHLEDVQAVLYRSLRPVLDNGKKVLVLPVLIRGGPDANSREDRLRTRYAVLSALHVVGFTLSYPNRMTALTVPVDVTVLPLTSDERDPSDKDNGEKVLRGANPRIPFTVPVKLFSRDTLRHHAENRIADPAVSRVLVLWINESLLGTEPLGVLNQLLEKLLRDVPPCRHEQLSLSIIGPSTSDSLINLLRDDWIHCPRSALDPCPQCDVDSGRRCDRQHCPRCDPEHSSQCDPDLCPGRTYVWQGFGAHKIYSPRATVFMEHSGLEDRILDRLQDGSTLRSGLELIYTIGTDRQLAWMLSRELSLRGAWPREYARSENSSRHVVLITERDSLYGRVIGETFMDFIPPDNLHRFAYSGGLDGRLPRGRSSDTIRRALAPSSADVGPRKAIAREDLPEGTHRLDYLRRLADDIDARRRALRETGRGDITAVGVIGSDIFDKLLILRALRSRFPKAIFFTTDLDARLFHPSEYPYTRNLIVASHYGLSLNGELGFEVAPFRDSYQTSIFMATHLALGSEAIRAKFLESRLSSSTAANTRLDRAMRDPWGRLCRSSPAVLQPLVFEIARSGPYRLPTVERETPISASLQPPRPALSPSGLLSSFLLGLLAVLCVVACLRPYVETVRKATDRVLSPARKVYWRILKKGEPETGQDWRGDLAVLGGLAVTAALLVIMVADGMHPDGEPLELLDGISIWPSVLLRFVAGAAGISFLALGLRKTRDTLRDVARSIEGKSPAGRSFKDYRTESEWSKRLRRIVKQSAAFFTFGVLLFYLTHLWPGTPYRGTLSQVTAMVVTYASVVVMVLVTFFVMDVLAKSTEFLRDISERIGKDDKSKNRGGEDAEDARPVRTAEKDKSKGKVQGEGKGKGNAKGKGAGQKAGGSAFTPAELRSFTRIVASHSHVIGGFIYFPFILVLLMAVARLGFFDNWDLSWPLIVLLGFILAGTVFQVAQLRRAAATLRRRALARLATMRFESPRSRGAEIDLVTAEIRELRRGAFCPLTEDPVLAAVALPFGGTGALILLERLLNAL